VTFGDRSGIGLSYPIEDYSGQLYHHITKIERMKKLTLEHLLASQEQMMVKIKAEIKTDQQQMMVKIKDETGTNHKNE
jgi:hypothetical protein